MSNRSEFQSIVQSLLAGEIICEITQEHRFNYLSDEVNRQRVDDYLAHLNRRLRQTTDGKAFICAYANLDDKNVRSAIRNEFRQVVNELAGFVRWHKLVQGAQPYKGPLLAGDMLQESDLLYAIEQSQALSTQLNELCRKGAFVSQASQPRDKLRQVLRKLTEFGYLVQVGHSGAQYQATARWSWLYDVMEFIRAHERLEIEDSPTESESQSELFL
ncbi:condensin complex protein MksE [Marinobacterium sedimentorum]|uniref:condensin complex protein MksE n=1 Tax=Marinobacterium sedimentorum TaxID=2927804 RepID=UPI0020C5F2EB|nr:hypothetical protein [Marinobacterium sedimentorum]MCP8687143.1 hypothetical protein [Marinobacterium sedimentorum]